MKFIVSTCVAAFFGLVAFAGENVVVENQPNTMRADIEMSSVDSRFVISGDITDKLNNETLAGAAIHVAGEKVYSDLDGHFSIPVDKPGVYTLTVELISYETAELQVEVKDADSSFAVELAQR